MNEGQGYMKYPCSFLCAELVIANKKVPHLFCSSLIYSYLCLK